MNELYRETLLEPVSFSEPTVTDHKPIDGKHGYLVTVEFAFTGSPELFRYRPNGYQYGSSQVPYVYQPNSNEIEIEVEWGNLDDRDRIIQNAKETMSLTYTFVATNNKFIVEWNQRMTGSLKVTLENQRATLKKLYSI